MAHSLHSIELETPGAAEAPHTGARRERNRQPLWLAVFLPNLAFEIFPRAVSNVPAVVVEPQQAQTRVIAANASARAAGIEPGSRLSTAFALAASLQAFERSPRAEQSSLESLAGWAERLTSLVSLEPREGLLLEVSGSLRLFGSLEAIKSLLAEELTRRALTFRLCVAPTATAASWLARAAGGDVHSLHDLAGSLSRLPLAVTRWPRDVQELLREIGVRTVGECARLPRDGFARRVGVTYLHELDRAFGRRVEVRAGFNRPERWRSKVELFQESTSTEIFMEAIEQMLDELVAELRKKQRQIRELRLVFEHLHRAPTIENFDLLEPVHDREQLLLLIRDRLERRQLPVPAIAVRVETGVLVPLSIERTDLFERVPVAALARALLERLQERLGVTAVYAVRPVAEHRPERAWVKLSGQIENQTCGNEKPEQDRPLWLLQQPVPLSSTAARDHYQGSIEICSGPERIESGWWDEQDIARDYYIAISSHGQRLWVFRDRRSRVWHLHGLFG
ncbi:MAG TPA: DNA polymerase Y family protein [Gammaproteobacteria bacterium]|jgi:protein ImuB|nr:DNA polymerase Y family protein [Gammaproteobacteria bacterium]